MMTSTGRLETRVRTAIVALAVLLLAAPFAVALARPHLASRLLHSGAARWREMHTPGGGRDRILQPDVLQIVASMRKLGWQHYRFAPRLENDVEVSPFIVEASWPIRCRLSDDNVVGYRDELTTGSSCQLIDVIGKYALAHCRS